MYEFRLKFENDRIMGIMNSGGYWKVTSGNPDGSDLVGRVVEIRSMYFMIEQIVEGSHAACRCVGQPVSREFVSTTPALPSVAGHQIYRGGGH